MTRFARRVLTPLLAVGLAGLAAAADPKMPASPADRVDWSGFAAYGDVVGEVMKADDSGLTLRMSWYTPGKATTTGSSNSSRYRGRSGGGNQNNQMMQRMRQMQAQATAKPVEHHQDFDLKYADAGLVRLKQMPVKTDDNGRRVTYTNKELEAIRLPHGAPGYAAARTDLRPGDIVEVVIVRDRALHADKVTPADLRVKYAVVLGHDPDNAADPAAATTKKK